MLDFLLNQTGGDDLQGQRKAQHQACCRAHTSTAVCFKKTFLLRYEAALRTNNMDDPSD